MSSSLLFCCLSLYFVVLSIHICMLHYLSTQSMWNLLKENMKSRAVHDESWWSLSTQKMAKNIWMRKELISQFRRYYHCDCNLIFSLLTEAPLHIHRKRRITMSANRWILAIFQLGWIPSWISAAEHNATKGEELWVPIDEILQIFQLWINPCSRAQCLCILHVNKHKGFLAGTS